MTSNHTGMVAGFYIINNNADATMAHTTECCPTEMLPLACLVYDNYTTIKTVTRHTKNFVLT